MKKYSWILGGLLGLTMFLYICSPATLDVTDSNWMLAARLDTAHHNIMSFLYRDDQWRWPLTLFNTVTYPTTHSATYADIIPTYAIPCKLLRGILPDSFHYFGIVLMVNFILQGVFAVVLLQQLVKRSTIVALGTVVIVTAPVMLYKAPLHVALTSHWLILMSLWIYFHKERLSLWLQWGLVTIALFTHPYLWVMCVIIVGMKELNKLYSAVQYFGNGQKERWLSEVMKSKAFIKCLKSGLIALVFTLPSLYVTGFFSLKVLDSVGWCTLNNSNLNAFISPTEFQVGNLVKPMSFYYEGQIEGFAYLGFGMLLLAVFLIPKIFIRLHNREWWKEHAITLLMVLFFTLFAIGNLYTWNKHLVYGFNLPAWAMDKYGIFRACGRFIWPVWYIVVLVLLKELDQFKSNSVVAGIVVVITFAQLYDLGYCSNGIINTKWNEFRILHATKTYPDDVDKLDSLIQDKKCVFVSLDIIMKDSVRTNAILHYLALKKIAFLNTRWCARRSRGAAREYEAIQKEIANGIYRKDYIYFLGKDQMKY